MAMTTAMEEWLPPVLRIARPCLPISNDIPKPFGRNSKLVKNLETLLPVKEDLEKSGRVHLYDGRQVRLISNLASGGEGTVYETDQIGVVCKIYHPNRLTDGARRKIELMVTRRVSYPEICWPTEAVRDGHGIFRGFLMPRAFGEPLGHGPFIPPVWLAKHPNWTRRESVNLTIRILEGIEYLHRIGVLLGDINPMNILVNGANTFYLVDCDSFQVEGFPCPVGSINFVAPEIQGKDFAGFLRTPEHELFAVATLAFMIMMPGKQPYSHQGGADGVANIKKMHFPYPLSGKGSKSIPEGPWRFCWSHLTWGLQKAFHASFDSDFKGQLRVDVSEWLQLFRKYERLLLNNNNVFKGPLPAVGFDLSLLPQNRRYWKNGAGKILPNAIPQHGETELQRSIKMIANALQHAQAKKNQGSSASTGLSSPSAFGTPWKPQLANPLAYASSPSVYPGAGKWYTTTLVWPIIAPVKALLESIVGGIVGGVGGFIVGGIGKGLVVMILGKDEHNICQVGVNIGFFIGAVISLWKSFGIIWYCCFPGLVGSVGGLIIHVLSVGPLPLENMRYGSPPPGVGGAIWGGAIGIVVGIFVSRILIGERNAADYIHTWWGKKI